MRMYSSGNVQGVRPSGSSCWGARSSITAATTLNAPSTYIGRLRAQAAVSRLHQIDKHQ